MLANGLEVLVLPSNRAPIVTQLVYYKVGSADEEPGKSGLAHFLEHLMFKGTRTVAPTELSRTVARSGGRDNAFTTSDYTGFYQTVAPAQIELMMRFEADRMANLVITEKELLPERDVVLEERRLRTDNSPTNLLAEQISLALWGREGYGNPTAGWPEEVRQLGVADAEAFYRRWYAPNNAVLIIAGDVRPAGMFALAEKYFGVNPRRDVPPRVRPDHPAADLPRDVERRDPRVRQAECGQDWVAPSYRMGETRHAYALQALGHIMGGGQVSRLWQRLVMDRKIALSASADYDPQALGLTSFGFWLSPAPGHSIAEMESALAQEIDRLLQDGVTAQELSRAVNRVMAATVYWRDGHAGLARLYGSTICTGGTVADVEQWAERIAAVTREQILEAARAVLTTRQTVRSRLLPQDGTQ